MACKTCGDGLDKRDRITLDRYEVAAERRTKCGQCSGNTDGTCTDLGLPIVELTRTWAASCPRGQFGGIKQACPNCGRMNQFLSKSSLCQWCEIGRENDSENHRRRTRKPIDSRIQLLPTSKAAITEIEPTPNLIDGCSVVWVYWAGGQRNNELWHSVRLAQENVQDAGAFTICGDIPDWYKGRSIRSPRVSDKESNDRIGSVNYKKWLDSIVKLQRIIDDTGVTETFLWLYDDTFIVRKSSITEIAVPRFSGQLSRSTRSTWRSVMTRTGDVLGRSGFHARNYSTHYPIVFEKQKLQQTIDRFRPDRQPLLVESLYQNQWGKNPQSHDGEFEYVNRVRRGWTPHKTTIVANVGQFNTHAQAAISSLLTKQRNA